MIRVKNSAKFEYAYHAFKKEYETAYALHLSPDVVQGKDARPARRAYTARALVAAHALGPIVLHDKQIPASCARKFERLMQALPKRRMPKDPVAWFSKNLAGLQVLLQSADWPDKGTREERIVRIGPFVVHNQTQADDIAATAKILETADALMRKSGVPDIEKILYGDVYFVGQIEKNRKVMAKYYLEQDTVAVLLVKRFEESILLSLIHEFGHRYYRKVWRSGSKESQRKIEWEAHHHAVGRAGEAGADLTLPKIGDRMETSSGGWIVAGYGPTRQGGNAILFEGGGGVLVDAYIRTNEKNARKEAYPTFYSAQNDEEHFCEALSLFCAGELKEPHRTNFEAIVGVPPKPEPVVVPAAAPRAARPKGPKGQIAMFNPSRREAALRRRISNP